MTTVITREQGYPGLSVEIVRITTTSTLTQVVTAGWYNNSPIFGESISPVDLVAICYSYGTSLQATALFTVAVSASGVVTFSLANDDVVLPTTAGNLAIFNNTSGQLTENIAALNNVPNSSATPGTVRAIWGEMTSTSTTMTSGNLVGVRGSVTMVGASGGFIYGTQGKVIISGTLSGSEWTAGLFGQLDISAATINAGQAAAIWGDYGSTSHTLTDQTGLYGIAFTNTTAAVPIGQLYLYGGATNLFYLNTNAGLSGTTYFKAAGTGASSWGEASWSACPDVLTISINGTTYYIGLKSSNA